jgi:hypothetical protein
MATDNAANTGEMQVPKPGTPMHECGQHGAYGPLCNSGRAQAPGEKKNTFERDHVPSKKAITIKALEDAEPITGDVDAKVKCIKSRCESRAHAIVIPAETHRTHSRTCGNQNKAIAPVDAKNLNDARDKDIAKVQAALDAGNDKACADAYREAAKKVKEHDIQKMINEIRKDCGA